MPSRSGCPYKNTDVHHMIHISQFKLIFIRISKTAFKYPDMPINEIILQFESDTIIHNLCNPFKYDLRCALSFPLENKVNTTEKGAAEVIFERVSEIC